MSMIERPRCSTIVKQHACTNSQPIRGHALAQYALGWFYTEGRGGLPKDDREAARGHPRKHGGGVARDARNHSARNPARHATGVAAGTPTCAARHPTPGWQTPRQRPRSCVSTSFFNSSAVEASTPATRKRPQACEIRARGRLLPAPLRLPGKY